MPRHTDKNSSSHSQWTASRCLRLLRPISSRIEPLRRLARTEPSRLQPQGHNQQYSQAKATEEPQWVNHRTTKKKTYSRSSRREPTNPTPSSPSLEIPTPFRSATAPPPLQTTLASSPIPPPVPTRGLRADNLSRDELEKGLAAGLSALLDRTLHDTFRTKYGALTLVATSLAKIPQAIRAESAQRKEVDPDCDDDVVAEVYGELEGWGPHADPGFAGLREVVRAHGLGIVMGAVEEGLLGIAGLERIESALREFGSKEERIGFGKAMLYSGEGVGPTSRDRNTGGDARYALDSLALLPKGIITQAMRDGAIDVGYFAKPFWQKWLQANTPSYYWDLTEHGPTIMGLREFWEQACLRSDRKHVDSMQTFHHRVVEGQRGNLFLSRHARSDVLGLIWASMRETGDWRRENSHVLRNVLVAVAATVAERTNADGRNPQVNNFLAASFLAAILALRLLEVKDTLTHADIEVESLVRALWLLMEFSADETRTKIADDFVYMASACAKRNDGGKEGKERLVIDGLLGIAKTLDDDLAIFLQNLALRIAQGFDKKYSSRGTQVILREMELQVEGFDVLDNSSHRPATAARKAPLGHHVCSGERSEDSHESDRGDTPNDSGYFSVDGEACTPSRTVKLDHVASPDELERSPAFWKTREDARVNERRASLLSVRQDTEDIDAISHTPKQNLSVPSLDRHETDADDRDDRDELIMSTKKRQSSSTFGIPSAKRQRQVVSTAESDDELL